jgi:hypothetical protein
VALRRRAVQPGLGDGQDRVVAGVGLGVGLVGVRGRRVDLQQRVAEQRPRLQRCRVAAQPGGGGEAGGGPVGAAVGGIERAGGS